MLLARSAPEGGTDEIDAKADIQTTQEPRRKLIFCQAVKPSNAEPAPTSRVLYARYVGGAERKGPEKR